MNGRIAKRIRKATDDLEVRGTAQWCKKYKQLKREYKNGSSKNVT